jgi:hypothetical protein
MMSMVGRNYQMDFGCQISCKELPELNDFVKGRRCENKDTFGGDIRVFKWHVADG